MYRFLLIFIALGTFAFCATNNIPDDQIIYTWGYGKMIYKVLEAVRMVIQDVEDFFKIIMALGFLFVTFRVLQDGRINPLVETAKITGIGFIIYGAFLHAPNTPAYRYQVFDEVTTETYIVDEIPIGIGKIFALTTSLERGIVEVMERGFSTPNSISMRKAGFGFSMEAVNTLKNVRPLFFDSYWVQNMNNFIGICLYYNSERNPELMDKLARSNDLYNDLLGMKEGFPLSNFLQVNMKKRDPNNKDVAMVETMTCKKLGEELQRTLNGHTNKLQQIHMLQLGITNTGVYETKMNGVGELYHTSHANARNMLQQIMLVHAYRDGIKNMEKMYGLGAGALSTTASTAHYAFFNQMLHQTILAQKFLPLIKSYFTALVLGISWLIISFAILTRDLKHARIFTAFLVFLIVWTPLLTIINYLNDLYLEDKFKVYQTITEDTFGFNIAFNTEFFMQVQEQSVIIGYLAMLTPVLAYALAKGSDVAMSSVFSGFGSALMGGARAGSLDATKQAQSTESSIAIGKDTWGVKNGVDNISGVEYSNGRLVTQTESYMGSGRNLYEFTFGNGNTIGLNANGNIVDSKLNDLTASNIANNVQSLAKGLGEQRSAALQKIDGDAISAVHNTVKGMSLNEQEAFNKSLGANIDKAVKDLQEQGLIKSDEEAKNIALATKASASGGFKLFGTGINVEGSAGYSQNYNTKEVDQWRKSLSTEEQKTAQEAFQNAYAKTVAENDSVMAQLSTNDSLSISKAMSDAASFDQKYQETMGISSSTGENALNNMIRSVANAHLQQTGAFSDGTVTQQEWVNAVKYAATSLDSGNISELRSAVNNHGLSTPETFAQQNGFNFNESSVLNAHRDNIDKVELAGSNYMTEVNKAQNITSAKVSNIQGERTITEQVTSAFGAGQGPNGTEIKTQNILEKLKNENPQIEKLIGNTERKIQQDRSGLGKLVGDGYKSIMGD